MPDVSPILNFLQLQMQTQPGLFAATVGLIVSSSYVLLMVVTRLGDIKPGVQSLVLSALIHVVMAMFWGNLTLPATKGGGVRNRAPEPVAIRQVIVEEEGFADPTGVGKGSGSGNNSRAVWDRIVSPEREGFARIDAPLGEKVDLPTPERAGETLEPAKGVLPALPMTDEVKMAAPQPAEVAELTKRNAVDLGVEIGEETAESRPGVVVAGAGPQRAMAAAVVPGGGTVAGETVDRQPRQGRPTDANIAVQISSQPAAGSGLLSEDAPQRKQTEMQTTQRRTGPARTGIEIDDAGVPGGVPDGGSAPGGSPTGSKFARAGQSTTRGDRGKAAGAGGMPERSRTTGDGGSGGGGTGASAIAALSPLAGGVGAAGGLGGFGDRPGISRPAFSAIPQRGSAKVADTYRLRNLPQRQKMAVKLGATQDSERAVEVSLRWLALHQSPEGYWDADGYDANCPDGDRCWGRAGKGNPAEVDRVNNPVDRQALASAGQQSDTGLTALVLLTFLGAGYTHEEGQYADQIDRAVRWLIRQQQSNGFLGGKASHYERMYCHGMATYALGEACGMMADPESDPQLRQCLQKAVGFIVAMQNPTDGGWRYMDGHLPKQEGDMSMFGWQLMALKSSEIAGMEVPEETQAGMVKFLRRISAGDRRGLASYRFGESPKPSMTAEALFSRQMLGMKRDNPSSLEAVEYLMRHPPRQTEQDLYYWYYGTLAMYQYGGDPWRRWNDQLRDTLVATQRKQGHAAGSWDPKDNWSLHGGRLYSTALSTLCLEVYYRFLPLYQLNSAPINDMGN